MREDEGKTEEDTDTDDDGEKGQGFTNNGEPEFKPKKVNGSPPSQICLMV